MPDQRFSESELAVIRRAFARQMMALANVWDERVEQAFATIRREDFLGSEPWQIVWRPPRPPLPQNDPACIYQDVVVALQPGRGVNNGSPSLHTRMLHDLAVEPGQSIAHIGAGAGYYTAMLAELTGPSGRVTAFEYDEDAGRAGQSQSRRLEQRDRRRVPTAPLRRRSRSIAST